MGLIGLTWKQSGKPLALYDYYIAAALVWFVIQAVYESIYLTATLGATGAALTELVGDLAGAAPRHSDSRICLADRFSASASESFITFIRCRRRMPDLA